MEEYERAENEFLSKINHLEKKIAAQKAPEIKVKPLVKDQMQGKEQVLKEIIRKNPVQTYTEPLATRLGYGNALARLGEYEKIFVLNADLSNATLRTLLILLSADPSTWAFRRRT
jgi:hypothetical protein